MQFSIQKSLLQLLSQYRNGYLALASGSLLVNILLGMAVLAILGHERVILVPPNISQTFWVGHAQVSPEYLSEMSLFFVSLRLNVTLSNAKTQHELLLRYVDPRHYETLKIELLNEHERLQKQHISTAFYPIDIRVDSENLSAAITGDLVPTVGANLLPTQRITYQIHYRYNHGRLWVESFTEVKRHA